MSVTKGLVEFIPSIVRRTASLGGAARLAGVPGARADGEHRHREGMRSKLKRLVGRSWLVEVSPGLFAPAEG
jgi:hypothetical protein